MLQSRGYYSTHILVFVIYSTLLWRGHANDSSRRLPEMPRGFARRAGSGRRIQALYSVRLFLRVQGYVAPLLPNNQKKDQVLTGSKKPDSYAQNINHVMEDLMSKPIVNEADVYMQMARQSGEPRAINWPVSLWLTGTFISFVLSVVLWCFIDQLTGLFVATWVPSILALGALIRRR